MGCWVSKDVKKPSSSPAVSQGAVPAESAGAALAITRIAQTRARALNPLPAVRVMRPADTASPGDGSGHPIVHE
jgi:hypothetical protein